MPEANQQLPNGDQREALIRVLSVPRFTTYLKAAGHDWDRAWLLYIWNAKLGEAFHMPIQTVEVALRNRLCSVFTNKYGLDWGTSSAFYNALDDKLRSDLDTVKKRIRNKGKALENGQIVAGLSFGFWVGMLQPRYYPPIWSTDLTNAFPQLPVNTDHRSVASRFSEIATLRNRISHHEPIIKRNISADYSKIMSAIDWMCPHTRALMKPHCRVSLMMRERP